MKNTIRPKPLTAASGTHFTLTLPAKVSTLAPNSGTGFPEIWSSPSGGTSTTSSSLRMLNHNNHFHVQGARPTAVFRIICSALKVLLPKEKIKRRLMPRTEQNERRVSAFHWRVTSGALALGAMFVLAVLGTRPAQAQTTIETVLHNFASPLPKGGLPLAGVIRDSAGNL